MSSIISQCFRIKVLFVACGLAVFGTLLNIWVVYLNDGMPVEGLLISHGVHIPMTPHTKLNWLADWIEWGDYIYSPGDFFLIGGRTLGFYEIIHSIDELIKRWRRQ